MERSFQFESHPTPRHPESLRSPGRSFPRFQGAGLRGIPGALIRSLFLLALAAGLIGGWSGPQAFAQQKLEDYEVHSTLTIGGDFTLTAGNGREVRLQDFRGKIVLLSFGYTHCPDACPMTLAKFVQVNNALGDQKENMQAMLITLDPERDTGELLETYVHQFDAAFLGLGGTLEEVARVAKLYLARFQKREVDSQVKYLVDHTTFSYLVDQRGRLRYLFNLDTPPVLIAEGVRRLLVKASI